MVKITEVGQNEQKKAILYYRSAVLAGEQTRSSFEFPAHAVIDQTFATPHGILSTKKPSVKKPWEIEPWKQS